jgi:hypothetical protein
MNHYSLGLRITGPASGAAFLAVQATTKAVSLRALRVRNVAATASSLGLIRAATAGTASSLSKGVPSNPESPLSDASIATAWSAAATIPGSPVYLERLVVPATVGAEALIDFRDEPLIIVPGVPLLLWNFGAGAASDTDVRIVWAEGG